MSLFLLLIIPPLLSSHLPFCRRICYSSCSHSYIYFHYYCPGSHCLSCSCCSRHNVAPYSVSVYSPAEYTSAAVAAAAPVDSFTAAYLKPSATAHTTYLVFRYYSDAVTLAAFDAAHLPLNRLHLSACWRPPPILSLLLCMLLLVLLANLAAFAASPVAPAAPYPAANLAVSAI